MKAPWTKRHSIPLSIVLLLSRESPRATRCEGIERSKTREVARAESCSIMERGIEKSKTRELAQTVFLISNEGEE